MLAITRRRSARAALNEISPTSPNMIRLQRASFGDAFSIPWSLARSHPELFRSGRLPDTREIVAHPNYIIAYRVRPGRIEVLSVLHARREYPPAQ